MLIRVDGTRQIGLGHVYRMQALALELAKRNFEVAVCSIANTLAVKLFRDGGITVFPLDPAEKGYFEDRTLVHFEPDLLVLDVLDTDAERLGRLKSSSAAPLIAFDDTMGGLQVADAVINAIVFHYEKHSSSEATAQLHEGPDFMILRESIHDCIGRNLKSPTNRVLGVMLVFGGTDTHNMTAKMLGVLKNVSQELDVVVNLGPGAPPQILDEQIFSNSPHRLTVKKEVSNIFEEFVAADLVICGGGNTLYELAALGVPVAAIATEPHEIQNILFWERKGTLHNLGWKENLDTSKLGNEIQMLLDDFPYRQKMAEKGPKVVDANGLNRCCEILTALLR